MICPTTPMLASTALTFYLGTHEVSWLAYPVGPLFLSHRRLTLRANLPRANTSWALDSGGFSELRLHGRWVIDISEYIEATRRYVEEIGRMEWAASMDWICEPEVLARTGLTVNEHQRRTVSNFIALRSRAPDLPYAPVLQGWTREDYERCATLYEIEGIDLTQEPRVGVGSICSRQGTTEVSEIIWSLVAKGLRLHAFGVKNGGLARFAGALVSADSMAWSYQARNDMPLRSCTHRHCSNCIRYAVRWRDRLLRQVPVSAA
jgi:hypothetical protein